MARKNLPQPDFDCPVCGAEVPGGSKSCPECGACEKSGWSEDQYLDGIDLPEDVETSASSPGYGKWWVFVALLLLLAMIVLYLRG
jgi:hypothetical protein